MSAAARLLGVGILAPQVLRSRRSSLKILFGELAKLIRNGPG
jgi:hypothetical protein